MFRWLGLAMLTAALAAPGASGAPAAAPGGTPAAPKAAMPGAAPAKAPVATAGAALPGTAAPAAGTVAPAAPQGPVVRVPIPLVGQAVATKVDFPGFSIREVMLTRKRDDSGRNVIGARVRVLNPGPKAVAPAFRVILYGGRELLGQIAFPAEHELPIEVAPSTTYPWVKAVAVVSTRMPDAVVIAPPEQIIRTGGASATGAGPTGAAGAPTGRPGQPGTAPKVLFPGGKPGVPAVQPGAKPGAPGAQPGAPAAQPGGRDGGRRRRDGG